MREHYGFNQIEYLLLLKNDVTIENLFDSLGLFMVSKYTMRIPISEICLYYFIDSVLVNPLNAKDPPSKIFSALFKQLDFTSKMAIRQYIKYMGLINNG